MAKVIYSFLCDDIRQELGNKVSLMGIYGDSIWVPNFPYSFPRLALMQLWQDYEAAKDFRIELKGDGMNPIKLSGSLDSTEKSHDKSARLILGFNNVTFSKACTLYINLYMDESDKPTFVQSISINKAKLEHFKKL